jgi:hypothetical protein
MNFSGLILMKLLTSNHRWPLIPISVISYIGQSLISELPISDWAWYRNFRCRTEESGVRHYIDIGIKFYSISDIQHPNILKLEQWLRSKVFACVNKGLGFESCGCDEYFLDIGLYSNVDIETIPISEWQFSVRHIFFWYRNNRCRCRISPTLRSMSMPTSAGNNPKPHDCGRICPPFFSKA